jgi:hypothetical protein
MWAAFFPREGRRVQGSGPEFEIACRQSGDSPNCVLQEAAQRLGNLVLYPVDWIGKNLGRACGVYVEVPASQRQKVWGVKSLPSELVGFCGANQFDFLNRPTLTKRPKSKRYGIESRRGGNRSSRRSPKPLYSIRRPSVGVG